MNWIDVKKITPSPNEYVLATNGEQFLIGSIKSPTLGVFYCDSWFEELWEVTHYVHLGEVIKTLPKKD
jgi:hypothetical protein